MPAIERAEIFDQRIATGPKGPGKQKSPVKSMFARARGPKKGRGFCFCDAQWHKSRPQPGLCKLFAVRSTITKHEKPVARLVPFEKPS
jgi:hypothetical protein